MLENIGILANIGLLAIIAVSIGVLTWGVWLTFSVQELNKFKAMIEKKIEEGEAD